jgi:hypothetical protein
MPPTRKSSYNFYRYLTGWIPICLAVANCSSIAYGSPLADIPSSGNNLGQTTATVEIDPANQDGQGSEAPIFLSVVERVASTANSLEDQWVDQDANSSIQLVRVESFKNNETLALSSTLAHPIDHEALDHHSTLQAGLGGHRVDWDIAPLTQDSLGFDQSQTTEVTDHLSVASSGDIPGLPSEVIQSGRPVPWPLAQVSPGPGMAPGYPGMAPGYPGMAPGYPGMAPGYPGMAPGYPGMAPGYPGMAPGYPGMAPGYPGMAPGYPGMWMMVWMPYGMPMVAAPQGQPSSIVEYPTSPYGVIPGLWPGTPIPNTGGMPFPGPGYAASPGSYVAVPPSSMVPWGGAPISGYGAPPSGYGYGMVPGVGTYGNYGTAMPPSIPVQPYALVTPPVVPGPSPLTVPALPNLPNVSSPSGQPPVLVPPSSSMVPLPSSSSGTTSVATAPMHSTWSNVALPGVPPAGLGFDPGWSAQGMPMTAPNLPISEPLPTSAALASDNLNQPLTERNLNLQGLYILQGDRSSARARLSGDTFLTPNLLVGGALDIVTGPDLTNSDGIQLTELYLATAVPGVPGLRFRLGQLDLTSYFDRNSFAKDTARDFFNSTFHTNPALIAGANATASRPAGLVQWAVNDDINLSAAVFSSAANITDFALDGFAGEIGFRTGDLILRGTFLTGRDTQFQGTGDRLDAYGVNAEWFIPQANLGLFGRYGRLNSSGGFSGDTYSLGLNVLDVFMEDDRLGLAYGRNLPNTSVNGVTPDVLEVFYDFEALPNIRMGFTFQQRNQLRESYAGFRIRGDLNLLSPRSLP